MTIAQHCIQVNFTSALSLLACFTSQCCQSISMVWSTIKKLRHVWLTCVVMTGSCVKTETTRELQVLYNIPIQLQFAIETLLLIFILEVVQDVIWIGYTIRSIVITRGVEWVIQILQLSYTDITWSLHDTVVHRTCLLTCAYEVVLLVSIVSRHIQGYILNFMASTTRECILVVAVSVSWDDTIIVNL